MRTHDIIHFLSIVLPFANIIGIVLTESKIPMFKHLYRSCVSSSTVNKMSCTLRDDMNKIIIDLISYLGIILFISKNTIHYGYVTGVATGIVLMFWSTMFPNLFLGKIIHFFVHRLATKNPYVYISIGILCIIALMLITNECESITQDKTKGIKIDLGLKKHKQ